MKVRTKDFLTYIGKNPGVPKGTIIEVDEKLGRELIASGKVDPVGGKSEPPPPFIPPIPQTTSPGPTGGDTKTDEDSKKKKKDEGGEK